MLILTDTARNSMLESLRVAHKKGMLPEIRYYTDLINMGQDELFNYFIIAIARLLKQ